MLDPRQIHQIPNRQCHQLSFSPYHIPTPIWHSLHSLTLSSVNRDPSLFLEKLSLFVSPFEALAFQWSQNLISSFLGLQTTLLPLDSLSCTNIKKVFCN